MEHYCFNLMSNTSQTICFRHSTYTQVFSLVNTEIREILLRCQWRKRRWLCSFVPVNLKRAEREINTLHTAFAWIHTGCIQSRGLCVGGTWHLFKTSGVIGIKFNSKCGRSYICFCITDIYRCFCSPTVGMSNFLDKWLSRNLLAVCHSRLRRSSVFMDHDSV